MPSLPQLPDIEFLEHAKDRYRERCWPTLMKSASEARRHRALRSATVRRFAPAWLQAHLRHRNIAYIWIDPDTVFPVQANEFGDGYVAITCITK